MLNNWNQDECRREISVLLGKTGLSGNLNIEDNLEDDYIIECLDGVVNVRAKRLRCESVKTGMGQEESWNVDRPP